MNYISSMELATLLSKTKHSIADLALTESKFLHFLLSRVNRNKIPTHGYLAWPGVESIIDYTGLGDSTIQKIRKTLVAKGYLQIISGKGPNSSNHYYINAQKIVDGAVRSGEALPKNPIATTQIESQEASKQHRRDTSGLKNNKPKEVDIPVDKPKEPAKMDTGFVPRYHRGSWAATEADIKRIDYEQLLDDEDSPF